MIGVGRVMCNKVTPAARAGGALCSFSWWSSPPQDGTHSPVWMVLFSTGTGTPGSPRTPQTKGWTWWEGRVMWNKEAPAAGVGGPLCSFPGMPAQPCNGTHSPVWIVLSIRTGNPKLDYYIGLSINLNFLIIYYIFKWTTQSQNLNQEKKYSYNKIDLKLYK